MHPKTERTKEPGQITRFSGHLGHFDPKTGKYPYLRENARTRPEKGRKRAYIDTSPERSERHAHAHASGHNAHGRSHARTRTPGPERTHNASTHAHTRMSAHVRTAEQKTRRSITLHRTGHGCAGPVQDPQK